MAVPIIQQLRVGAYVLKQRFKNNLRYPLVLMLEPLFRCNLACPGCGKIDYEDNILDRSEERKPEPTERPDSRRSDSGVEATDGEGYCSFATSEVRSQRDQEGCESASVRHTYRSSEEGW